jgi:hypothetical protein
VDVGTDRGWMAVEDAALHPGAIAGEWRGHNGTEFVAAPGVKAVGGGAWPAAAVAHTRERERDSPLPLVVRSPAARYQVVASSAEEAFHRLLAIDSLAGTNVLTRSPPDTRTRAYVCAKPPLLLKKPRLGIWRRV